jgi:hypothetical protein
MNAGRDVERLIADWFVEEAVLRAPDRVLDAAGRAIDRTMQRRSGAAWRAIAVTSPFRLAAVAAVFGVLLVGGAFLLLKPSLGTVATPPSPTAAPTPRQTAAPTVGPLETSRAGNLTSTFTSPLYGYSINLDPSWRTTLATIRLEDPLGTDATVYDAFKVTGTDTTIGAAAEPMGGKSFNEYLASQHTAVLEGNNPGNCKGSDPATWPALQVGDHPGRVMVLCNYEVVFVQAGDQVYQFTWGHDTFAPAQHLTLADFARVLQTVRFP